MHFSETTTHILGEIVLLSENGFWIFSCIYCEQKRESCGVQWNDDFIISIKKKFFSDETLNSGEIELSIQNNVAASNTVIPPPALPINAGKSLVLMVLTLSLQFGHILNTKLMNSKFWSP